MAIFDRLTWMKLVNADWGEVAYGDKVQGDTFALHWPKFRGKANAENVEIGDQIVLVQYGTASHIVEIIGGVVTDNSNRTHPYTRRAKVLWSSKGGVYPFSDFMGFSFHFQSGQSAGIENCDGFKARWSKLGLSAFQKHIEIQVSASEQKQTFNRDTQPTSDPEILEKRVNRLLKLKKLKRPKGNFKPKSVQTTVKFAIERSPEVKAWVLRNAKGICELCKKPGPFLLPNKSRYLEVHHVKHLAEQGPDHDSNAVAVCPNCHRLLHCGVDAKKAKKKLYLQVVRLIEYK